MSKLDNKELIIQGIGVIVPRLVETVNKYIEHMKDFVYVKSVQYVDGKSIKVNYVLVDSDNPIPDEFKEYEKFIEQAVKRYTYFYNKGYK